MTDETNYPPKGKVKLPPDAKRKRKIWLLGKTSGNDDPPRKSER